MRRLASFALAILWTLSLVPSTFAAQTSGLELLPKPQQRHELAEAKPQDLETNRWVRNQLLAADRHIVRREYRTGFRVLEDTRRHLHRIPDRRYVQVANWIYDVQQDMQQGRFHEARRRIGYIMQNLPRVGQGRDRQHVRRYLERALDALRVRDLNRAGYALRDAYNLANRSRDRLVRGMVYEIRDAHEYTRQGRARSAGRICRFLIQRLVQGAPQG